MNNTVKLIAFDLDGTLTQHKTKLSEQNRNLLTNLDKNYKLLMVGAGDCMRIFNQMEKFPIDIIGNYGMQTGRYCSETGTLELSSEKPVVCDRKSIEERVMLLRKKYGLLSYAGDSVEFHDSGVLTFAILGTKAIQSDKLAYDPDRSKRRRMYDDVCKSFPEYNVFVGGSSSFDMAPKPYDKYYALDKYCSLYDIKHSQVLYAGDDYGCGGNDYCIYNSDIGFIKVDDYTKIGSIFSSMGLV